MLDQKSTAVIHEVLYIGDTW